MDEKLKEISALIDRAAKAKTSLEALQYSQAACNCANAVLCVVDTQRRKTQQ